MNWQFARRFILQPCFFCIKWLLRQKGLLSKALIEMTHLFVYSQHFVTLIPLATLNVRLFVSGSALFFASWFILTHKILIWVKAVKVYGYVNEFTKSKSTKIVKS